MTVCVNNLQTQTALDPLEFENLNLQATFKPHATLFARVLTELLETSSKQTTSTHWIEPYYYFSEVIPGTRHPIIQRSANKHAKPELVIDFNAALVNYPLAELGTLRISPDQSKVAFSVDLDRSGKYALAVWHLQNQRLILISDYDVHDIEWHKNNLDIFFTASKHKRPWQLLRLNPFSSLPAIKILQEDDQAFTLHIKKSGPQKFLLIRSESVFVNKNYLLEFQSEQLTKFPNASDIVWQELYESANGFVVKKIAKDGNTTVMLLSHHNVTTKAVPLPEDCKIIEEISALENQTILTCRSGTKIKILSLNSKNQQLKVIYHDPKITQIKLQTTSYNAKLLNLIAAAPNIKPFEITVDLENLEIAATSKKLAKNSLDFQILNCQSKDQTYIPLTITANSSAKSPRAILLQVYGAYGTVNLGFEAMHQPLLNRGLAVATAHVRGSGYHGVLWHRAGVGLNKIKGLEDFEACAELLQSRYPNIPIYAYGRSAGGLIVASSIQRRAPLFKAAVLDVPFLNPLQTLLEPTSPLRVREFAEWGNPNLHQSAFNIKQYSPTPLFINNDQAAPNIFILTSLKDSLLPYTLALDWGQQYRALTKAETLILIDKTATHDSFIDIYEQAKNIASWQTFLLASEIKQRSSYSTY